MGNSSLISVIKIPLTTRLSYMFMLVKMLLNTVTLKDVSDVGFAIREKSPVVFEFKKSVVFWSL